jgi:hypothetical protein
MPQGDPESKDEGAEIDVDALLDDPAEQRDNVHDLDPNVEMLPDEDDDDEPAEGDAAGPAGAPPAGQPLFATCRRTFTAVHDSGPRPVSGITHIVIHSTEGATAAGGATWFANPESKGSAHLVVDDVECFRTLDDGIIPFGAPGVNTNGFHIEHAGFAKWTRRKWMRHKQTLRRGAFKAAFNAKKFNVPMVILSAEDLKRGKSGFVTHATVTKAFNPGGHTDPGDGFPLDHYMRLVKEFAEQMDDD